MHGIGPVWSPDGSHIVYQRVCTSQPVPQTNAELAAGAAPKESPVCREGHDVVLVNVARGIPSEPVGAETVIHAPQTPGPDGPYYWSPFSVSWSPDSTMLLYDAWAGSVNQQPPNGYNGVVAVPIDTTRPATFITLAEPAHYYPGTWSSKQSWGRIPAP
jgi:hypothetical protein